MGSLLGGFDMFGGGGGGGSTSMGGNSGGAAGGGNFSPTDTTTTTQTTEQWDNRRVSTANGAGSLVAQDGSTLNLSMIDGGALDLAGNAVDRSMSLAAQIATTLGAKVGQFSSDAVNSVDSLTHLLDQQSTAVSAQGQSNHKTVLIGLAIAGLVAIVALRRR
jgi:hypothetical protein